MEQIIAFDRRLFRLINYDWHNNFFDSLMPWLRNAEMWYPLYLFLALLVAVNYMKNSWWWMLFFVATIVLANFVSSNLIKEHIIRVRPCNDPSLAAWIRVLVGYRPQSSSFTSSHAANHFAMAMFLYISLKDKLGKWPLLFFLWAFFICFAQVYVGVHFPLDVTCGGLIGIVIGYLLGKSFNKKYGLV
jgi:membrane-associated phospholipid phosphatase